MEGGTEFNEQRLTELAEAGGGRYTCIKSPEQIPTAFEEELQGLLAVAAKNVRLEVGVSGASMRKLNGQPLDKPASSNSVQIGNVRSGERGLFLFELKPSTFEAGAAVEVTARLTFDDPQTAQRMSRQIPERAPFLAQGEPNAVEDVVLYSQVLEARGTAEEAAKVSTSSITIKPRPASMRSTTAPTNTRSRAKTRSCSTRRFC